MADDSPAIELSLPELREVTGYPAACARPAPEIFERERPDDRRPRVRRRVPSPAGEGNPGQAHPRVGRSRRKSVRGLRWSSRSEDDRQDGRVPVRQNGGQGRDG